MTKRTLTKEMRLTLKQPKMNKQNTTKEYFEQLLGVLEYDEVEARCYEVLVMNNKEYETFKNNLLADYKFLEGLKCGTGCDIDFNKDMFQMTADDWKMFYDNSYRVATMIYNKDTNDKFYINTEGYSYARYCLFD